MILGPEYEKNIGENIGNILNIEDEIYDFEITPNRPDCLGILGIANELKCAVNRKEKQNILIEKGDFEKVANIVEKIDNITVNVESEDVKRYMAVPLYNVKNIETPKEIKERLQTMGVNPKGNILVDISNYIMFETGNPTHIFDLDILNSINNDKNSNNELVVKIANNNGKIELLNDEKLELSEDLTISVADENLALVGVMGGKDSGVNENTKNILIEIATFERKKIRDTSRKYNVRTESSARFEKKLSPRLPELAFLRMITLMKELGVIDDNSFENGKINVIDYIREDVRENFENEQNTLINFNSDDINKVLGMNISEEKMIEILTELGFKKHNGETSVLVKPYIREDIERKEDLAEEVIRFYGYDNLNETLPKVERGNIYKANDKDLSVITKDIRNILKIEGYNQIITYGFISKDDLLKLEKTEEEIEKESIYVLNKLSSDYEIMRNIHIPSILKIVSYNERMQNDNLKLYEIAAVFKEKENLEYNKELKEETILTICRTSNKKLINFDSAGSKMNYQESDIYLLKKDAEKILHYIGINKFNIVKDENNSILHAGQTIDYMIGNKKIATLGKVKKQILNNFDVTEDTYICEINITDIIRYISKNKKYNPITKYPKVTRDLSIIVDKDLEYDRIRNIVKKQAGSILENIELFDIYVFDKGLLEYNHKKSVSISMVFRDSKKTLEEQVIVDTMDKILKGLEKEVGAVRR
ncbi:MAG: phenylalanine--tRNA ligase subunit beta [Clostridiales bacterium]|nr:phenylalanine--tRNA ligase subunit beta [Clostridiales bacterium]